MITARYTWEIQTLQKALRLHRRTRWQTRLVPVVAITFVGLGVYLAVTAGRSWIDGLPPILFGVLLLLLGGPLVYWQFRRSARRSPSYGCEMTWTFDPQQIGIAGEGFNSTFTWKKLYSASISPAGLLLYPQKNLFHWIPRSAFQSQEDFAAVTSLVRENCARTRTI
jgi:YcxB-like protein